MLSENISNLHSIGNISQPIYDELSKLVEDSDLQDEYGRPMPLIGMYIASASLICILAMVADLYHGLRNRKLWFPCNYFAINAATLTVIAVAMKLPVDLTSPMNGPVDQIAKIGSMAFLCTMMSNLLPSLATMSTMELVSNITALGVLVITLVVNVCIEINTGVIGMFLIGFIAVIYVVMLLVLLIIYTCSAFTILKSKEILESKYQKRHQEALRKLESEGLTIENLKQHVRRHWIMAATGSPQFITACYATTRASGVICAINILLPLVSIPAFPDYKCGQDCDSDYKWSTWVILITQSVGILFGTIAPLCRCFADLSLKSRKGGILKNIKVFKVESYWTQKLYDWKKSSIPFRVITNHKGKILIEKLKVLNLNLCIIFQKAVVIVCKMIALMPIFFLICVLFCWKLIVPESDTKGLNQDYVLTLQKDTEFAERTLKGIEKSMDRLIDKAQKKHANGLIKLLQKSKYGFEGVGKYDSVPCSPTEQIYLNSWSLPLVTLTTIAASLPDIEYNTVFSLMASVSEGLAHVRLVEESLNVSYEYFSSQKAAKWLWREVEVSHKWLGNKLRNTNSQVNTTREILEWFKDTSNGKNTIIEDSDDDKLLIDFIIAKSMNHITESILRSHQNNINEVTQQALFEELHTMIADILAACLTNLPQVIEMKCHTNLIEKREASVYAAAKLLGKTMHIIDFLQRRDHIPSLKQDELPFIEKWRAILRPSTP